MHRCLPPTMRQGTRTLRPGPRTPAAASRQPWGWGDAPQTSRATDCMAGIPAVAARTDAKKALAMAPQQLER